jgi:RNA polymerase sigma-70 factor, ECF subfamily
LRRFALSLAKNVHDADDLVQTAVVRALSSPLPESVDTRLESWMYTVVKNLWIDETRRRKVRGVAEPVEQLQEIAGDDGRTTMEARSELAYVKRAFDKLSPELRGAAALVILNGLSYREAAELLEVPIGTVLSRVARTRQALLQAVEPKKVQKEGSA